MSHIVVVLVVTVAALTAIAVDVVVGVQRIVCRVDGRSSSVAHGIAIVVGR